MRFIRSIAVELLKLKRKRLLYLIAGAVLFSIVTAYLPSISTGRFDWQELLSASLFIYSEILFLLFSYITGLVFAGEFENGTIDAVMSTPISISEILFGKAIVVVALSGVAMLGAIVGAVSAGITFRFGSLSPELFGRYCSALAIVMLIQLCYVPLYMLVSVSTRKTIYPSVIGMLMVVIMMVFAVADYAAYIPPCFPVLIHAEILGGNAYTTEFLHAQTLATMSRPVGVALLCAFALLPIPFCRRYFRRY